MSHNTKAQIGSFKSRQFIISNTSRIQVLSIFSTLSSSELSLSLVLFSYRLDGYRDSKQSPHTLYVLENFLCIPFFKSKENLVQKNSKHSNSQILLAMIM